METIVSLATPAGNSGVAVIRVSGEKSKQILQKLISENLDFEPRKMYLKNVKIKDFQDQCLVVFFKGPFSFTGEDVVEIQSHGGYFLAQKIIEECLSAINEEKNFLVAAPAKDSIYLKIPFEALSRDNICLAQTPQGGLKTDFLTAHIKALEENFSATDDISLVSKYIDKEVKIINGDDINFKLTTSLDYILAKELIKWLELDMLGILIN